MYINLAFFIWLICLGTIVNSWWSAYRGPLLVLTSLHLLAFSSFDSKIISILIPDVLKHFIDKT